MKQRTIALLLPSILAVLGVWVFAATTHTEKPLAEAKLRIGVFKSQALAIAYFKSDVTQQYLSNFENQAKKAQAAGDQKTAEQLNSKAQAMRQRAHLQIFGKAPIDNILAHIKGAYPEVARATQVQAIAQQVVYQGPSVEIVDLTDLLVQKFEPDEDTLKAIESISKHPSVDPSPGKQLPPGHPPAHGQ